MRFVLKPRGACGVTSRFTMVVAALAVLAAAALASPPKVAPKLPAPGRTDQIMDDAWNRMVQQLDVWFKQGDYPRDIQLLREMNLLDSSDYETATNLGWLLENTDQTQEALSVYIKFKEGNPQDPDSPFPEAYFYYFRKLYAKVLPLLEPTLGRNPHPNSFRLVAHSYEKMGMLKDALRIWDEYIAKHPDDLTAKANRKRVSDKVGSSRA